MSSHIFLLLLFFHFIVHQLLSLTKSLDFIIFCQSIIQQNLYMEAIYSLENLPPSLEYSNRLSPISTKILKKANINLKDLLPVNFDDIKNMYEDSVSQQTTQQRWKQQEKRRNDKLNILLNLRQKLKNNEYDMINYQQKKCIKNKENNTKDVNNKKSSKKFHSVSKRKKSNKQKQSRYDKQYYCNYFIPKAKSKKMPQKHNSFTLSQRQFGDNQKKKQKGQKKNEQIMGKNFFEKQILSQQNQRPKNSPKYEKKEKTSNYVKKNNQMQKKYLQLKLQQTKQIEKLIETQMNQQIKRDEQMRKVSGKQATRLSKIHLIERMQVKNKIKNLKRIQQQILEDFKNEFLL